MKKINLPAMRVADRVREEEDPLILYHLCMQSKKTDPEPSMDADPEPQERRRQLEQDRQHRLDTLAILWHAGLALAAFVLLAVLLTV